ncbi:MAG: VOC family protein [Anaerolineae bacterium]
MGAEIGAVHLRVRDLAHITDFYTNVMGARAAPLDGNTTALHPEGSDDPLFVLHGDPAARPARGTTGLFHAAVLLPTRADLATWLHHALTTGWRLQGASDHAVSEAIYLADPAGNGLEVYRDRPRAEWPMRGDQVAMVTDPLDLDDLLAAAAGQWVGWPPGTRIGHVHLRVNDIAQAADFYGALGFAVMARYGQQAVFLGADGYHHHIGANTWGTAGAPPPPPDAAGLMHIEIRMPDAAAQERTDPAGLRVRIGSG